MNMCLMYVPKFSRKNFTNIFFKMFLKTLPSIQCRCLSRSAIFAKHLTQYRAELWSAIPLIYHRKLTFVKLGPHSLHVLGYVHIHGMYRKGMSSVYVHHMILRRNLIIKMRSSPFERLKSTNTRKNITIKSINTLILLQRFLQSFIQLSQESSSTQKISEICVQSLKYHKWGRDYHDWM